MDALTRDLAVLSEPVRIRLLAVLEEHELGVGEVCRVVQLPQSTVSRHLKALQVGGWIRRRAEGTSGRFRVTPGDVDPRGWRLWEVVREGWRETRQAEEDRLRLDVVLASRTEGESFFGSRSAEWDALRHHLFGEAFLPAGLVALIPSGWTVGDLGCGTGPALVELAPVVRRVIGVDRELRMVELARARVAALPNVEVRLGGLDALPLDDAELDAATCMLVLHHVEDPSAALREVCRVLRRHGTLVVVDMLAHDRDDWARSMGHRHQGFEEQALAAWAEDGGMRLASFRTLPVAAQAEGPPLFLAVLRPV